MSESTKGRIKIEITFNIRLHRRPIQLVVFVPVGLSSICSHLLQVLLVFEVSSVARPAEDVNKMTKGLQEPTQLIEWDDGET